jgi:hypothetical protein
MDVIQQNKKMLEAWDANESVWSIELGGIGPGYEQCIQLLAFEMVREYHDKTLPQPEKVPRTWADDVVSRLDKACGGFSGAQVGQAKWLAYRILAEGYEVFIERARKREGVDMIQVSKKFPGVF